MNRDQITTIAHAVEVHAEAAIAYLARLVDARPCIGEEAAAQAVVADELQRLGLTVRELPVPASIGDDPLAGLPQVSYAGRVNLLATTGEGPLTTLFNGHVDVVPADPGGWRSDPYRAVCRDGWMYGRGAGDMKGGFAMVALALAALRDVAPEALEPPIGFLSVIEEECTGNGTLAALRGGVVADRVVLPEPTDLRVLRGGVGIVWVDVELRSPGAHAKDGVTAPTALDGVVRLIPALRELGPAIGREAPDPELGDEPYAVNVGTVTAGDWRSTVATTARLGVRVAHPSQWTPEDVIARVEALVRSVVDGTPLRYTVRGSGYRAQGYAVAEGAPVVQALLRAHADVHGIPTTSFRVASTTDARYYVNQAGIDAVCYGPVCRNMHGADESVELRSILDGARTLAVLLAERSLSPDPATPTGAAGDG